MSKSKNSNHVSRNEMLQVLYFHFLSKNYCENYLDNLTDKELRKEYERYIDETSQRSLS